MPHHKLKAIFHLILLHKTFHPLAHHRQVQIVVDKRVAAAVAVQEQAVVAVAQPVSSS
jgi:hypothetical protein